MSVKLLTEYRLEFVSLKGGCTGSSESTLVKMPHCVAAQFMIYCLRADEYDTLGTFISQVKEKENSDKYHKSSFSCMQCAVSCSFMLKIVFVSMQTHENESQLGNYISCAKSAFMRQSQLHATRVLKQQQHVY